MSGMFLFLEDGDGHWYLVPEDMERNFFALNERVDNLQPFFDKFNKYKLASSPSAYPVYKSELVVYD